MNESGVQVCVDPISTSCCRDSARWYAVRISEYVIPPATNTIRRCRTCPVPAAACCGALFQVARVLRRDVVCGCTGRAGALALAFCSGESFTYGKRDASSFPETWSYIIFSVSSNTLIIPTKKDIRQGQFAVQVCTSTTQTRPLEQASP